MASLRGLTPRGKALRHWRTHRNLKEDPAGSNTDQRPTRLDDRPGQRGIREAQVACASGTWLIGTPWCGEWLYWALERAGVHGLSSRIASVALIEDDARAGRGPFRGWISNPAQTGGHWRRVFRGDAVVLFGRGVHVEGVRSTAWVHRARGYIITEGGNTSAEDGGSQSNGGQSAKRKRRISDIHGLALVDYPGTRAQRAIDRARSSWSILPGRAPAAVADPGPSSDARLLAVLDVTDPRAGELHSEISHALAARPAP